VVVVGAGPAGLAAGVALLERGVRVAVVDHGPALVDRGDGHDPDFVNGAGGAGLYSDGKFSFFPSASSLWKLSPPSGLDEAYLWVAGLLAERGIAVPPAPSGRERGKLAVAPAAGASIMKAYPSMYVGIEDRRALVERLADRLGDALLLRTHARLLDAGSPKLALRSLEGRAERLVSPRAAIYAAGRFGPLGWPRELAPAAFCRVEIGVRLEQPADRFFLAGEGETDPKWICRSADRRCEWRTFCCCKQGEVISTSFQGIVTVSGRADCPPTGRSNVGLNVRLLDRREAMDALERLLERRGAPSTSTAAEVLADPERSEIADTLGPPTARRIAEGLSAVVKRFAFEADGARLYAPALEGLGYYPAVGRALRVDSLPIWVAGDNTGRFRGIVAALISGRMAAAGAAEQIASGPGG